MKFAKIRVSAYGAMARVRIVVKLVMSVMGMVNVILAGSFCLNWVKIKLRRGKYVCSECV